MCDIPGENVRKMVRMVCPLLWVRGDPSEVWLHNVLVNVVKHIGYSALECGPDGLKAERVTSYRRRFPMGI